jgi:hypothetical protein
MFPCSKYKKRNLKYVVSNKENSDCCSEYVLYKVKCDVESIPIRKWQSLKLEEDCLERESEVALRLAKENLACYKQLEKQKKFLKSKRKDMLRHSLKMLDKLEEVEERER